MVYLSLMLIVGSSGWFNVILSGVRNFGSPMAKVNGGQASAQHLHIHGSNVGSQPLIPSFGQRWVNVNSSQCYVHRRKPPIPKLGQDDRPTRDITLRI